MSSVISSRYCCGSPSRPGWGRCLATYRMPARGGRTGADVDALPLAVGEPPLRRQRLERAAERQRGGGEHHRALAEQLVPEHAADGERRDAQGGRAAVGGAVEPDHLGPVGLGGVPVRVEHAHRRVVHLVERGERGLALARLVGVVLVGVARAHGGDAAPGGVADELQGQPQHLRQLVDAAGRGGGQQRLEVFAGLHELVGYGLVDQAADPAYGQHDRRLRQLGGDHRGDPVDQLVGLVDHHDLVLGQDRQVAHGVDGQQRVVGDDDVDLAGPRPGQLGEALGPAGAAAGAQALLGAHGELPPRLLADARHQLVAVAGLGLLGPLLDALHHAAGRAHLARVEELVLLVLLGPAGRRLVAAQVVAAALEYGERRLVRQLLGQRLGQPGQVAVDELALQRDGGGGDDDGGVAAHGVPDRGHEVGQ